jgi:hypothetical protein
MVHRPQPPFEQSGSGDIPRTTHWLRIRLTRRDCPFCRVAPIWTIPWGFPRGYPFVEFGVLLQDLLVEMGGEKVGWHGHVEAEGGKEKGHASNVTRLY